MSREDRRGRGGPFLRFDETGYRMKEELAKFATLAVLNCRVRWAADTWAELMERVRDLVQNAHLEVKE